MGLGGITGVGVRGHSDVGSHGQGKRGTEDEERAVTIMREELLTEGLI